MTRSSRRREATMSGAVTGWTMVAMCCVCVCAGGTAGDCPLGWTMFQSRCYSLHSSQQFLFLEATQKCEDAGGALVTARSDAINQFLADFVGIATSQYWINAHHEAQDGVWLWGDDGGEVVWDDWWDQSGGDPALNCVMVKGGTWRAASCDSERGLAVCEYENHAQCADLPGHSTICSLFLDEDGTCEQTELNVQFCSETCGWCDQPDTTTAPPSTTATSPPKDMTLQMDTLPRTVKHGAVVEFLCELNRGPGSLLTTDVRFYHVSDVRSHKKSLLFTNANPSYGVDGGVWSVTYAERDALTRTLFNVTLMFATESHTGRVTCETGEGDDVTEVGADLVVLAPGPCEDYPGWTRVCTAMRDADLCIHDDTNVRFCRKTCGWCELCPIKTGYTLCTDKMACIRKEQRCDGLEDCVDGSDEEGCEGRDRCVDIETYDVCRPAVKAGLCHHDDPHLAAWMAAHCGGSCGGCGDPGSRSPDLAARGHFLSGNTVMTSLLACVLAALFV